VHYKRDWKVPSIGYKMVSPQHDRWDIPVPLRTIFLKYREFN